ncbi:MAG: phage portal protein [Muribaculaceae bacterium]|nr:phage portal protein [Muribaculaceae bacterium]
MNLVKKLLFGKEIVKSAAPKSDTTVCPSSKLVTYERELAMPYVADANFIRLFMTIPEVFFPIDFIASRIAKAHFEIKRMKDDSVVWCNRRMNRILANPNCLMGWSELIYSHFVYKLTTGNAFIRAAMSDIVSDKAKYRWCDHFWPILTTNIMAVAPSYRLPIYGLCSIDDLVDHYEIHASNNGIIKVPTKQIWHDRDLIADLRHSGHRYLKSKSRLASVMKPISNLVAVYEARNVIYVKRGGIGFLVSLKRDETGSTAMEPKEKKEIQDYLTSNFGLGEGQTPIGVTDVPLSFVRTNLSISELQPFEETLQDAVTIAGAFGIPDVLVPRKDHSTFNNQATAEKTAYSGVIIPMAQKFCNDFTIFLGLDKDGLYLDCNFSDVDCLQTGMKEAEEVKRLINDRCSQQFSQGMITLNDWRAQIHESQIPEDEMPLFSKLKYLMTDEELAIVQKITANQNINPLTQTSTGESNHERNEKEPDLSDESE